MAAYIAMLQGYLPTIAGHLLAASVMNAPGGLLLAKIIRARDRTSRETKDTLKLEVDAARTPTSIEAAARRRRRGAAAWPSTWPPC